MGNGSKCFTTKHNFILQQGLSDVAQEICSAQFTALQFQPRMVASLVLLGIILQSAALFIMLSALLWWSALIPQWNPFDMIHNRIFGTRPGTVLLGPAPAPRRFAQGMAGTFSLVIGTLLLGGWGWAAFLFEALFLSAIAALMSSVTSAWARSFITSSMVAPPSPCAPSPGFEMRRVLRAHAAIMKLV